MLKKLIAPFQKILLTKKLCPGCTMPLDKANRSPFNSKTDMVICSCKRMFIYDKTSDLYRRATIREAEVFSSMK